MYDFFSFKTRSCSLFQDLISFETLGSVGGLRVGIRGDYRPNYKPYQCTPPVPRRCRHRGFLLAFRQSAGTEPVPAAACTCGRDPGRLSGFGTNSLCYNPWRKHTCQIQGKITMQSHKQFEIMKYVMRTNLSRFVLFFRL